MKKIKFLILCGLFFMVSCASYAPPVRVSIGSLPEPHGAGKGAVRFGYGINSHGGFVPGGVEAGDITVGLSDKWDINVGVHGSIDHRFIMAGPSATYHFYQYKKLSMAVLGGFGLGRGGVLDRDEDGVDEATGSFALGGFTGVDFGVRLTKWVGFYEGNRFQVGWADNGIPITGWGYHAVGVQFNYLKYLMTSLEVGGSYYLNKIDKASALQVLLSLGFDWGR